MESGRRDNRGEEIKVENYNRKRKGGEGERSIIIRDRSLTKETGPV